MLVLVNPKLDDSHLRKDKSLQIEVAAGKRPGKIDPLLYPLILPRFGSLFALNTCYVPSRGKD